MVRELTNSEAIVSMVTTMMGTGVTFMPYAFKSAGYIMGTLFIIFNGMITFFSCYCISYAAKHSKKDNPTYSGLATGISRSMGYVVNISIFFNGYLAGINFYRYLTDLIIRNSEYIRNISNNDENSRKVLVFILAGPFFYLLLKKKLSGLVIISYLSVMSISYLTFLMIYLYFSLESRINGEIRPFNSSFGEGIPFFISSMVCQANMVRVYNEMKSKSHRDIIVVSLGAAVGGVLINGLTGLFGYLALGESIKDEVLTMLSNRDSSVNVFIRKGWDKNNIMSKMAVYGMMVVLFCGYPMQIAPVVEMLFKLLPETKRTEVNRKLIIVTLFLICISLTLVKALYPKTIKKFCGAVFSNPVAFVYPFVYYLSVKRNIVSASGVLCTLMILLSAGISIRAIINIVAEN